MTISEERAAEIRRLFYREHWKVGTIVAQLGEHPDAVARAIGQVGTKPRVTIAQASILDPYKAFVAETLRVYPRLRATRLCDMIASRGYSGSVRHLRDYVKTVRPTAAPEAFLSLETMRGEQSQIDWAHVGQIPVGDGQTRPLWVFVMVLSFSRAMWAELVIDLSVHSLLRSLVRASVFFEGVSRQWLFDNPKIVVLERRGSTARFHPALLALASAMCVEPRLCGVRKPTHKGKVERAIRYLRDRFFAARVISSVGRGNEDLLAFIRDIADKRQHPRIPGAFVESAFADEKRHLLALPNPLPPTDLVEPIVVDKTAFVAFDTNRYSVPSTRGSRTLTLVANDDVVRVLDGDNEIARHPRDWRKHARIELPEHRAALLEEKRGARDLKGRDRLRAEVPAIDRLFPRWIDAGRNVGFTTARVLTLLDLYGATILALAIDEALARGVQDPGALAVLCENFRRAAGKAVPLSVSFASHVRDRDVIPHDLGGYDGD